MPLYHAYEILQADLTGIILLKAILQIAIKAINNMASHNGFIPTLLVFDAYLQINLNSLPSPSILKRIDAIQKTMRNL